MTMDTHWSRNKYTIDGVPVSPRELMDEAAAMDQCFDRDPIKTTSRAANILRDNGCEVGLYAPPENQ